MVNLGSITAVTNTADGAVVGEHDDRGPAMAIAHTQCRKGEHMNLKQAQVSPDEAAAQQTAGMSAGHCGTPGETSTKDDPRTISNNDPLWHIAEQVADCFSYSGYAFIEDDKIEGLAAVLQSFLAVADIPVK